MSKPNDEDQEAQRERIAEWVKKGRKVQSARKERNQALIHLGLAALDMIKTRKITAQDISPHIIENKVKICQNLIIEENERNLF